MMEQETPTLIENGQALLGGILLCPERLDGELESEVACWDTPRLPPEAMTESGDAAEYHQDKMNQPETEHRAHQHLV
jgi:hypothetical protein